MASTNFFERWATEGVRGTVGQCVERWAIGTVGQCVERGYEENMTNAAASVCLSDGAGTLKGTLKDLKS